MRKLKLSLDALQVDSFHAMDAASARGTVPGHNWTDYADESCFQSCNGTCPNTNEWSCYGGCGSGSTCGGTCGASCGATCTCPPTEVTACGCETWETCPGATVCA